MSVQWKSGLALGLCLGLALIGGCSGGGSGGSGGNNNGQITQVDGNDPNGGTLTMQITFPRAARAAVALPGKQTRAPYNGDIPQGTHAVRIVLTNPNTGAQLVPPKLVTAPTDTQGDVNPTVTVEFAFIPAGPVRVQVTAYPDAQASQLPLATGTKDGQIVVLSTTTINILLQLTADHVVVTPKQLNLMVDTAPTIGTLTGQVFNAQNQPVLFPLQWTSSDSTIATVTPDPNNSGTATVTAIGSGRATITAKEPNSGLKDTATVVNTVSSGSLVGGWLVTHLTRVGLPTVTCPGSISLPSGQQATCSASDVVTFGADRTYTYVRAGLTQPLQQGTWQVVGTTLTTTDTLSSPPVITTYSINLSGQILLLNTQAISTTNQDLVGLVYTLRKQ